MGQSTSNKERGVFELMLALLGKHGKSLPKLDLKLILKWVAVKHPNVTAFSIFTLAVWDDVGVKVFDLATMGYEPAVRMLPTWRIIFETLKKQEQPQAVSSAGTAGPHPALTLSVCLKLVSLKLKSSRSHQPHLSPDKGGEGILSMVVLAACIAHHGSVSEKEGDPFNLGPIDPDAEPGLFPPDPH